MKQILECIKRKPELYEQSPDSMWNDPYISERMLEAHLDTSVNSATRKIELVTSSVDWITGSFPPHKYPVLLDLGCGPGIYTELFKLRGYDVFGMDLSERSIRYALNSADNNNLDIHYILGDYTQLVFKNRYHLITMIYCDFGVLSTETRHHLMAKIFDSLFANGVFLFDVFTGKKYDNVMERKEWEICENGFWHRDLCLTLYSFYRYDEDSTFLNQYAAITENNISLYNVWEHVFTLEELKLELTRIGFRKIDFYANTKGDKYRNDSETICVAAQK